MEKQYKKTSQNPVFSFRYNILLHFSKPASVVHGYRYHRQL